MYLGALRLRRNLNAPRAASGYFCVAPAWRPRSAPTGKQKAPGVSGAFDMGQGRAHQPIAAAFTSSSICGTYWAKFFENISTSFCACAS